MLIKMLTLSAGPDGIREAGKVYDLPKKEAAALIEGGYAVEFKREDEPERAVNPRAPARAAKPETKTEEPPKE